MHFGGTRPPLGRRKLVADDEDAKRNRKQVRIDDALSRELCHVFCGLMLDMLGAAIRMPVSDACAFQPATFSNALFERALSCCKAEPAL